MTAPDVDPLAPFSAPTRAWFTGAFEAPTPAQAGAWAAIAAGDHALVVAPTGSGKTLSAFLASLDRLLTEPPPDDPTHRCRVVYVSPLKALAVDVEKNLRSPLVGIRQAAQRLGTDLPEVEVGIRTGDTPASERRAFGSHPPDVLITTPESLYLVLTSSARAGLAGVRTVVVDEIHAVAGTKRGAHLALSLERLDALLEAGPGPAQRVGLSATVRPVETVARFLAGARPPVDGGRRVTIVQPPAAKEVDVSVVVPVPDLADLTPRTTDLPAPGGPVGPDGADAEADARARRASRSVWPHVEERIADLVAAHRSTLVFTNSRRAAERLTSRLNEVWAERTGREVPDVGAAQPAAAPAQSGTSAGVDTRDPTTILARAHHGSMSRAERTRTETELKSGRLPAVVATSSLELGIDMGAVDLVVQVGSPPSVASGLQRIGRAGHQVGAVSRGVLFPTHRGDLVPAAVTAARMRVGAIEELSVPANPLDVLAQQVVAMVAVDDWTVDDLARVVRRAAPFANLGDATLRAVLDMLAGRYPSEEFGELRPRLVWDRATGRLTARPGALRLATTSGGTIPDRGLYGVFLATGEADADAGRRGGRRVGELDEEMVYESRVGDTFTLGSSTWRIEDITPDRVLVSPAPGLPGRLPFWKGDQPGRPAELGRAVGRWVREVGALPPDEARRRLVAEGLDAWAADNVVAYLREQQEATSHLPDDTTLVVERFRDEVGDWRVVLHSPFGARVHAPWAIVLAARLRERHGVDAAVLHADDGIVLRLPDTLSDATWDVAAGRWRGPEGPRVELEDLLIDPDEVAEAVRTQLGGSALFAARFREAAARSLLLPRRRPDRRQPLWQQRQRSSQLLGVASRFPDFPVLLEAARECLQDDFDVDGLARLMRDVAARRVRVVEVTTPTPSPFARSLLFGYTAQFLYEGDAPLAERRAAALTLDPSLLAELLGQQGAAQLADLLDPAAVERTEAEVMGTAPGRQARHLEDVADVVRRHGPLTTADVEARTLPEHRGEVAGWLAELEAARRVIRVRIGGAAGGAERWAAVEDAGRLRDALGVALPVGVPEDFTAVVPDPLGDLVRRYARTHGPFTAADVAAHLGLGVAVLADVLRRLEADGALVVGRIRPEALGGTGDDLCDADVLRLIRRRSLAALRAEVEPVPPAALGVFLPRWQGVAAAGGPARLQGVDGLVRAVEQLAGAALPASAWETLVLPARVADYDPRMLDELLGAGEVLWAGHAPLAGNDGLVSLHLAETADLTLPLLDPEAPGPATAEQAALLEALLDVLGGGGGFFLPALVEQVRLRVGGDVATAAVREALWHLVWAGRVTNDSLSPLRARLGARGGRGGTAHPTRPHTPRGRTLARLALRPDGGSSVAGPDAVGRWSLLPGRETDPTVRARALAAQLLDRHGVLTRGVAAVEGVPAWYTALYRVLAALEEAGQVRRGYFVEHLGGSQFALPGAVDLLRQDAAELARPDPPAAPAVVLAATDPANPYGAALAWPDAAGQDGDAARHRPGRKAGAVVVLVAGALVLYLERGGRTLLSFSDDPDLLAPAARALADAARGGALGRLTVSRADGAAVLDRETLAGPLARALADAGFGLTPRGLRLRDARG
ncbi:MAG: ATP-dependent helicase [Actinomycetales bacterium]|nr:ATP-dependent helicase [Actinomycetales bacterium]